MLKECTIIYTHQPHRLSKSAFPLAHFCLCKLQSSMHPNTFPSLSSRSIPFPSTTTILIRHYTASILGPEGAFAVYERRLLSQEGCLTPFHIWAYRQFVTVRVERTSPSYTLSRFLCLSCARILSFFLNRTNPSSQHSFNFYFSFITLTIHRTVTLHPPFTPYATCTKPHCSLCVSFSPGTRIIHL